MGPVTVKFVIVGPTAPVTVAVVAVGVVAGMGVVAAGVAVVVVAGVVAGIVVVAAAVVTALGCPAYQQVLLMPTAGSPNTALSQATPPVATLVTF